MAIVTVKNPPETLSYAGEGSLHRSFHYLTVRFFDADDVLTTAQFAFPELDGNDPADQEALDAALTAFLAKGFFYYRVSWYDDETWDEGVTYEGNISTSRIYDAVWVQHNVTYPHP